MLQGLQFCVLTKIERIVGTVQAKGHEGFPGGLVADSPPANAGLIPDLGRSYMPQQLNPRAVAVEPVLESWGTAATEACSLEPVLHSNGQ